MYQIGNCEKITDLRSVFMIVQTKFLLLSMTVGYLIKCFIIMWINLLNHLELPKTLTRNFRTNLIENLIMNLYENVFWSFVCKF